MMNTAIDIFSFQEAMADKMNQFHVEKQARAVDIMADCDNFTFITFGNSPLIQLPALMRWRYASFTMLEIWKCCVAEKGVWTTRGIKEASSKLLSKLTSPPLLFRDPKASESRRNWMVSSP
jgi:hypothetical protein